MIASFDFLPGHVSTSTAFASVVIAGIVAVVCSPLFTRKKKPLVERLINDENGRVLHQIPYPFARLFSTGQELVIYGQEMKVISCTKKGSIVTTRVKLGRALGAAGRTSLPERRFNHGKDY